MATKLPRCPNGTKINQNSKLCETKKVKSKISKKASPQPAMIHKSNHSSNNSSLTNSNDIILDDNTNYDDIFNNRFTGEPNEFIKNVQKYNQKKLSNKNNISVDSLSSFYRFFLVNKDVAINNNDKIFEDYELPNSFYEKVYENFSENPNINSNDVLYDFNKPWNYFKLGKNENLNFEDVVSILKKLKDRNDLKSIMEGLSENPNVTMDFFKENQHLGLSRSHLSKNPNICISDLENF